MTAAGALRALERVREICGRDTAVEKLELLRALERRRLKRAAEVARLHEVLCFLRTHPDDDAVLRHVEIMLEAFGRRSDLRRHRAALADSGISGTVTRYRFFQPTASWLARRWPRSLHVDWERLERPERIEALLPVLTLAAEAPGLEEWDLGLEGWIDALKGPGETDAAFLVRRLDALGADPFVREKVYDDLDLPLRLEPGPDTPSRTLARWSGARVVHRRRPFDRRRPVLPDAVLRTPKRTHSLSRREAAEVIDLARAAMVARQRDLDVFSWASPDDVRIVDWGDGLQFACLGAVPERRLLLEAVYGFLTLMNGVPIGYVLSSALFGSSEIAYNVFDTWRGGESGLIYGRVMATLRHLFGSEAFTVFPYQLGGWGNDEGLASGAWWFYQKIGFRPRDDGALDLMRRELARIAEKPSHRSSRATLARLAAHNVYYFVGPSREDVIGLVPIADVGLEVSRALARRFGADRERAQAVSETEAAARLGVASLRGFTRGERLAWSRWAPLVALLPGVDGWSDEAKRAAVEVVRAKGGRRESDFVRRFDAHADLRRAVLELASAGTGGTGG